MNTLALQVQQNFELDPDAGNLFVLQGRKRNLVRILWHIGSRHLAIREASGTWPVAVATRRFSDSAIVLHQLWSSPKAHEPSKRIIGEFTRQGMGGVIIRTEEALGASAERPPTAAMRKFAVAIARHKGIKAPAGYTKPAAMCRRFSTGMHRGGARERERGSVKRKSSGPGPAGFQADTPLRIPYGNKQVALKLGARYGVGG